MAKADVIELVVKVDASEFHRQMGLVETKAKKTFGGVTRHSKGATGAIEGVRVGVSRMRNNFLLFNFTVGATIIAVSKMADRMQKVVNLERGFNTLNTRIGASPDFLNKLGDATGNLVNNMELMKSANNAVILGVAKNEREFLKLARGATILGQAVGLDAQPALESLVTGIGRQSRLMLDNLGIIVRVDQAYRKYADSLGITTDELTDLQRKEAFQIEALEKIEKGSVGLTIATETLSQDVKTLTTRFQNLVDATLAYVSARVRLAQVDKSDPESVLRGATKGGFSSPRLELISEDAVRRVEANDKVFSAMLGGLELTAERQAKLREFARNSVKHLTDQAVLALSSSKTNIDILNFFTDKTKFSSENKEFVAFLAENDKAERLAADSVERFEKLKSAKKRTEITGDSGFFRKEFDKQALAEQARGLQELKTQLKALQDIGDSEGIAKLTKAIDALASKDLGLFAPTLAKQLEENAARGAAGLAAAGAGLFPETGGNADADRRIADLKKVVESDTPGSISALPAELQDFAAQMEGVVGPATQLQDLIRILGIQDMPALALEAERTGRAFELLEASGMEFTNPQRYEDLNQALRDAALNIELMGEDVLNFDAGVQLAFEKQRQFNRELETVGVRAVASFGGAVVDAALGAEVVWGKFFKSLLKQIAQAIVQLLIMKALQRSAGPAGAVFSFFPVSQTAKGGIIGPDMFQRAQGGAMVRGGTPGRDTVPILAQQGESVLPVGLTQFLVASAREFQRRGTDDGSTGGGAISVENFTINTPPGVNVDGDSIRQMLEDNPDALGSAIRIAGRRGTL